LNAEIHGGVGEVTIRLPRNIGVQVEANGGIGSIEATGLRHNGDEYVNDAFGKSPITIHMTVKGGIGQINLIEEK
jgi:predicted membrane protein